MTNHDMFVRIYPTPETPDVDEDMNTSIDVLQFDGLFDDETEYLCQSDEPMELMF